MAKLDELNKGARDFAASMLRSETASKGVSAALDKAKDSVFTAAKVAGAGAAFAVVNKVLAGMADKIKALYLSPAEAVAELNASVEKYKFTSAEVVTKWLELTKAAEVSPAAMQTRLLEQIKLSERMRSVWRAMATPMRATALLLSGSILGLMTNTAQAGWNFNEALRGANTNTAHRFALLKQVLAVQQQTGASAQTLNDAAAALLEYGLDTRDTFRANVSLVTQMHAGLGVAVQKGAELAAIFERGLRRSAVAAADAVADLAKRTALSGDEAASLVAIIGRVSRLLGPGMGAGATQIASMLGNVAGQMKELGGNSKLPEILYQRLLEGTPEGAMMRGRAGIRAQDLNSVTGTQKAFEGLARSMQEMVRADPKSQAELYGIQLRMAAEVHGIAADEVRDYVEAMSAAQQPVSAAGALQKAYNEQVRLVGGSIQRITQSFRTLYQQALVPLFQFIAPVIGGLADLIQKIVAWKGATTVVTTVLTGASVLAVAGLTSLASAIVKTGITSQGVASAMRLLRMESLLPMLSKLGPILATGLKWTTGVAGGLFIGAAVAEALKTLFPGLEKTIEKALLAQTKPQLRADRVFGPGGLEAQAVNAVLAALNKGSLGDARVAVLKAISVGGPALVADQMAKLGDRAAAEFAQQVYAKRLAQDPSTGYTEAQRQRDDQDRQRAEELKLWMRSIDLQEEGVKMAKRTLENKISEDARRAAESVGIFGTAPSNLDPYLLLTPFKRAYAIPR